jgi:hypothetical protein
VYWIVTHFSDDLVLIFFCRIRRSGPFPRQHDQQRSLPVIAVGWRVRPSRRKVLYIIYLLIDSSYFFWLDFHIFFIKCFGQRVFGFREKSGRKLNFCDRNITFGGVGRKEEKIKVQSRGRFLNDWIGKKGKKVMIRVSSLHQSNQRSFTFFSTLLWLVTMQLFFSFPSSLSFCTLYNMKRRGRLDRMFILYFSSEIRRDNQ